MAATEASTTLTTFMLETSPQTRSVHLVGSWDGFSRPYPMEMDPRKGKGHWRGCHRFENIICDGDLNTRAEARNGGLKMGGRYWYYYRLDGDVDHHDPAEPSTSFSPVLPGQPVNVLEVPVELAQGRTRGRSSSGSVVFAPLVAERTMDPLDKYVSPRAAPVPRLPRLATSPASLHRSRAGSSPASSAPSPLSDRSRSSSPASSATGSLGRLMSFGRKGSHSEPTSACGPTSKVAGLREAISCRTAVEGRRGRVGTARKDRAARETPMDIGSPSLVDCSDPDLHCIPLSAIAANSLPGRSAGVARASSPLRRYIAERPREPSPLGQAPPSDDASHARRLKQYAEACAVARSRSVRSREPSPLRQATPSERVVAVPDEIAELADDEDDDFNFRSAHDEPELDDEPYTRGLSPPPSRREPMSLDAMMEDVAPAATAPAPPSPSPAASAPTVSHFSAFTSTTASGSPTDTASSCASSPSLSYYNGSPGARSLYRLSAETCATSTGHSVRIASDSPDADADADAWARSGELEAPSDALSMSMNMSMSKSASKRNAAFFGPSTFKYSVPDGGQQSGATLLAAAAALRTTVVDQQSARSSAVAGLFDDLGYLGEVID
ncbi:MAG: hypothetical protein M1832_004386 [Thelocarpon impressellum]|nr:MAG: hypothetical protein M1832_004386 [Thelocarpon impressellum]